MIALWDSVKTSSDKDDSPIPDEMTFNNVTILKEEIPETFANYFQEKINNLAQTCNVDHDAYNGVKLLNSNNENFIKSLIH